jgi:hypothetical protein
MSRLLLALLLSAPFAAGAEADTVPAQFWLDTRSGASVLAEPAVSRAVQRFLERPGARLVLRHGRGDESTAHAEELRGWLIALGVDAGRVELAESGGVDRTVTIETLSH